MSKVVKVLAWGILGASVALPASNALATEARFSGRVVQWAPAGGSHGKTGVEDLGRNQWVKGEYNRHNTGDKKLTLWNKSGYGTKVYSPDGSTVTKLHACEEHDWAPDKCTGWIKV